MPSNPELDDEPNDGVIETTLHEGFVTNAADAHLCFVVGEDTVGVQVTDDGAESQHWSGRFTTRSIANLCNWYLRQFPGLQDAGPQERHPVEHPVGVPRMPPTVVCLCGSTRFYEAFQQANYQETLGGKIVLSVGSVDGKSNELLSPEEKADLDELHLRKIDMADEVLVLNVDGYVGESTTREIKYAMKQFKLLRWWDEDKIPEWVAS